MLGECLCDFMSKILWLVMIERIPLVKENTAFWMNFLLGLTNNGDSLTETHYTTPTPREWTKFQELIKRHVNSFKIVFIDFKPFSKYRTTKTAADFIFSLLTLILFSITAPFIGNRSPWTHIGILTIIIKNFLIGIVP